MTDIDPATLFRCNPAVIQTEVEGEIVLLHPGDWDYFEFNESATALWRLLEAPHSFAFIVAALVQEFDVDPARCAADIAPLLQEMQRKGLVLEA